MELNFSNVDHDRLYINCSWKEEAFSTLLGREPMKPARDLKDSAWETFQRLSVGPQLLSGSLMTHQG